MLVINKKRLTPFYLMPAIIKAVLLVCFLSLLAACGGSSSSSTTYPDDGSSNGGGNNHRPIAHAGEDQYVDVGATVYLSCKGSTDSDGDTLSYSWGLLGLPHASKAHLNNPKSCETSFIADVAGRYVVTLLVSDGKTSSKGDSVVITAGKSGGGDHDSDDNNTANQAPQANAGMDQTVQLGATVELSAAGSSDPDSDELIYGWEWVSKPEGSEADLSDVIGESISFVADAVGLYRVRLLVSDGELSGSDTVDIRAVSQDTGNTPPVANVGANRHVVLGQAAILDGSASNDADGDELVYNWTLQTVPSGSTANLVNRDRAEATLTPDVPGEYIINLVVNDGQTSSSTAQVVLTAHQGTQRLDYSVLDAEYSDALERIIMVSADPNRIHIYDPSSQSSQSIELAGKPLSVSVSPNGQYAVVAHDERITYVNLAEATLIKTLDVGVAVGDVVLADNGYAYAFPLSGSNVRVRIVELANGAVTTHSGTTISGTTRAVLHPNGLSIYAATGPEATASLLEKYQIEADALSYLYSSNPEADYPVCGNLWLSEDGTGIFTACGKLFRATASRETDLAPGPLLGQLTRMRGVDHEADSNTVIAIPGALDSTPDNDTEVQIYNYIDLALQGSLPLPKLLEGGEAYQSHGRFVFFNSSGDRFYVIVRADPEANLTRDHGVVSFRSGSR